MKKTNWLSLMLALVMCLFLLPADAQAKTITETVTISYAPSVDLPDSDEIFAAYVEREMYRPIYGDVSMFGSRAREQLNSNAQKLYDYLLPGLKEIAAGKRSSSEFTIPDLSTLGINLGYSAEDLNVDSLIVDNAIPQSVGKAFSVAVDRDLMDNQMLVNALLSDCPYDMYWYDKSYADYDAQEFAFMYQMGIAYQDGKLVPANVTISFRAADAYGSQYKIDTAKTGAASSAVANAQKIVDSCASLTNEAKLAAYRDEICDLVSYNTDAAKDTYTGGYGDPWQLIYVFDDDSSTNVVCEGYSKAFQYLCDLSNFSGDIYCYSVTGTMAGGTGAGPHMWNIVQMNGGNYLVDVTNCDTGSIGHPDELFLVCEPDGGTWEAGYAINAGNTQITYVYDKDVRDFWGQDVLELRAPSHTHNWVNATCTSPKTCSTCGATEGEALGHKYSSVVTEPTCTEKGYTTYTCSVCNDSYTGDEVPANGHSFGEWEITTAPTCTQDGVQTRKCSACEETETENIAAKGHSMTLTAAVAPTCTTTGNNAYYTCGNCNKLFKDEAGTQETTAENEILPVLAHSYSKPVFTWAEDNTCKATYNCTVGGESATVDCTVSSVSKEASCEDSGEIVYTATVVISNTNYTDKKTVTVEALGHKWTAATCTDPMTCSVCGATEGNALGHSFGEWEITTAPTCTQDGVQTRKCSACEETETETIAAKGHSMTLTAAVAPTCTTTGNNAYYTCGNCNKLFKDEAGTQETTAENEILPVLAHSYGVPVFTWAEDNTCKATYNCTVGGESTTVDCTISSVSEDASCTVPGKIVYTATVNVGGINYTDTKTVTGETLGHKWTDATCTDPKTCSVCKATEGEAMGHTWTAATCTTPKTCSVCKTTEGDALGHTWTAATCTTPKTCSVCKVTDGDALGHKWDDATCTDPKTCSVCKTTEGEAMGHTWTAATCTDPKTCSTCNATEGDALGHTWTAATCTTPKTCSVCKATEGEAMGHTWTAATCTDPKTCSVCKATEGEAMGHTWTAATCTTPKTCSTCDATEGVALGHDYSSVVTEPTCTAKGYTTYTCSTCGDSYVDFYVDPKGHSYSEPAFTWADDHTCKATYSCTVCDESATVDCTISSVSEDASCTVPGKIVYTATVDVGGIKYTDNKTVTGEALGHSYGTPVFTWSQSVQRSADWTASASFTCSRCGNMLTKQAEVTQTASTAGNCQTHSTVTYTATVKQGDVSYTDEKTVSGALGQHSLTLVEAVAPTCTTTGLMQHYKCSLCSKLFKDADGQEEINEADTIVPVAAHIPGEAQHENEIPATCENAGSYDEVVYCSVCNAELSRKAVEVDAKGHTPAEAVKEKEVAATCEATGSYDEVVYCSVCNHEISRSTTIVDATGHTPAEAVKENEVAASCGKDGSYDSVVYCSVCDAEISRTTFSVPATGEHNYATETERVDPTCTEDGYVIMACGCGVTETTTLKATGHKYESVVTAPTCTEKGYTTHTCSVCNDTYTDSELPANGHSFGEWEITTAPTCTQDGVQTRKCSACEETETDAISATGEHHYATETERVDPTCTEDGYVIMACGCGATQKSELKAPGHTPGEAKRENEKPATCTETGSYDEVVRCAVCDAELSRKTIEVKALGHKYEIVVTEPTCTEKGYTTHTCSVCNDTYTDSELPATGHSFGEWEITTAPTCTQDGVQTRKCSACEETETDAISATGEHNYATETERVDPTCTEDGYVIMACGCGAAQKSTLTAAGHKYESVVTEPTCTEKGYTTHTCSVCNDTYTDSELPANGHSFGEWEITTAPTCTQDGVQTRKCSACEETETENIPATGEHNYATETERVDPTCTKDGYVIMACGCGATQKSELKAPGHTPGEAKRENEKPATCENAGSYDEVVRCATCNEIITSTPKTIDKLDHTPGEPVVENKVDATCQAEGSYDEVICCTVCEDEISRVTKTIDKLTTHKDDDQNDVCDVCGKDLSNSVEVEEPENGKIEVNDDQPETGDEVILTITPEEGQEVGEVIVTDEQGNRIMVTRMANGQYSFRQPAGKVIIRVAFKEAEPVLYTASIVGGNGSGSYAEGETVTISANAPADGMQFAGWTGAEGLTFTSGSVSTAQAAFTMPAADVTLTASYEAIADVKYIITFHANGGAGTMNPISVSAGKPVDLPACGYAAPEGLQFAGWSLSQDGAAIASPALFEADTTLYAVWTAAPVEDVKPVAPPKTGDDARLGLWTMLMLLSAAGIMASRKRRTN